MNKKQKLQYILGCLFGDAYILKSKEWRIKKNCYIDWVEIGLDACDLDFVTFFRDCIKCFGRGKLNINLKKSKTKNWNDAYRVNIQDQKFVLKMIILKKKFKVETDLNFDFLKGFWDSEGNIYLNEKSSDRYVRAFSTNKRLIYGIYSFLKEKGFKRIRISKDKRGKKIVYELCISGYIDTILFWKNIGFRLNRKQIVLEKIVHKYKKKLRKT